MSLFPSEMSSSLLGPLCHSSMSSMEWQISIDQQVGGCCHSEYDPATCFLGDLENVSNTNQEDVKQRCRSGAEELDVLGCPSQAWPHDLTV